MSPSNGLRDTMGERNWRDTETLGNGERERGMGEKRRCGDTETGRGEWERNGDTETRGNGEGERGSLVGLGS